MSRVVINLYPVSKGGGLQNSLSFLNFLSDDSRKNKVIVLVREGTLLEKSCKDNNINYFSIKDSIIGRLMVEFYLARRISKFFEADVFFTLFGNTPLFKPHCPSVSGFAFSNIIESDVNFWGFLPLHEKAFKKLKDIMRLYLSKRSDSIILETEHLKKIAEVNKTFGFTRLHVVKMAPSSILSELYKLPNIKKRKVKKILYLSGPHQNKNIHKLADVFRYDPDLLLYTTLPKCTYLNNVVKSFEVYGISKQLINLGPVSPDKIPDVISSVDAMVNVATLESFSNNWVEAWASKRLLIAVDEKYARASCNDAAVYIDLSEGEKSAKAIKSAFFNVEKYLENGVNELKRLPSPKERYNKFWSVIYESI